MIAHEKAGMIETSATAQKTTHQDFTPSRVCAKVNSTSAMKPVLENIVIDSGAFTHALSWVFSRPNTLVYGRDGLVRKAGRMAESMFSTSCPPVALEKAACGFQSHSGAEAMTNVNTPTTPNAAPLGITPTSSTARQQAIENALSMALFHIRKGDTHQAVAKSIRATSLLKQSCSDLFTGSV